MEAKGYKLEAAQIEDYGMEAAKAELNRAAKMLRDLLPSMER